MYVLFCCSVLCYECINNLFYIDYVGIYIYIHSLGTERNLYLTRISNRIVLYCRISIV